MGGTRSTRRLILLALVPFVVAGCPCGGSNCGAPTPAPTLAAVEAAAAAASAAAVPSMAVELVAGRSGSCFYRATSDGAVAFLDPWGRLQELVLLDQS